jgi:Fe-S cluster assembly iron-binding protein IscA
MNDPAQVLEGMRMLLERVRRETQTFYQQAAIPPMNSYRNDQLQRVWDSQRELLTEGRLYWGAIIQANGALMMPGDFHPPGEVVCSPDSVYEAQPHLLEEVASRIYKLKCTQPNDPELRVVADHITDEMHRAFCERIPTQLTEGRVVVRYTVVFYRQHLPFRMLGPSRLLPLLVHGRHTTAMVLPAPLWMPELTEEWKSNSDFLEHIERMQATDRAARRTGPVVQVTPAAVEAIRETMKKNNITAFVYISYQGGDKRLTFTDRKSPGDVETTVSGLRFLVEAETARKYWGLTIDFGQVGGQRGFLLNE